MMREYHVRFCERLGVKPPGLLGARGEAQFITIKLLVLRGSCGIIQTRNYFNASKFTKGLRASLNKCLNSENPEHFLQSPGWTAAYCKE
jgi:hypothetical protein